MSWTRWFLLGLLIGAGALLFWWRPALRAPKLVVDFTQQLSEASVARPGPEAFKVLDVAISGQTLRGIAVDQPSRLAWDQTIPAHAWLETSLGLQESAWAGAGDGVVFRVAITHEGGYEEPVFRHVNPRGEAADRRWIPVSVDLSPYAGRKVAIILNTRSGLQDDNRENDLAVWGAPRLVVR